MSERINFQSWWNDGPFRNDGPYGPLRTTYAKLYKAGADPDHIKALCSCLELGDLLSDMVALSRTKRKKQSHSSERTLPLREMKLGQALGMAAEADSLLKAALESLEEIDEIVTEMKKRFKGSVLFPALEEFLLPHIFRRY